ncbi:DoxX family membrane protein [Sphingomonas sp.]|uniref:DoxX family membrane protein n=1 Tax=Sphingomonas sp. TaxID=28214 RepID=UPI003D6CF688
MGDRAVGAAGGLELACRLLLCALFLSTGLAGLASPAAFAAGLAQMGVPFPAAAGMAATAINLLGPLILIADPRRYGWIAALILSIFTVTTIPFGHAFWLFDEPRRSEELHIAIEHASLIGGLLLTGLMSFRRWRARCRPHQA